MKNEISEKLLRGLSDLLNKRRIRNSCEAIIFGEFTAEEENSK
jgi:hypothetical protein